MSMCDFYNGGLWGNFSFVGSNWSFAPGYIKNVNTHHESVNTHHESFSSKKQVIKKIIAKKPLTNLYEMNSRHIIKVWNVSLQNRYCNFIPFCL